MDSSHRLPNLKRRDFLKLSGGLVGAATLPGITPARAANELNLIGWSGWADPIIVAPFEEKYGAKVRIKEYTSGEGMLALLSSSPPRHVRRHQRRRRICRHAAGRRFPREARSRRLSFRALLARVPEMAAALDRW